MRPITLSLPSGKVKMTLWKGTEDEESFPIKAINTKPYVLAYGIKYYLTNEEVKTMNLLRTL